jgi:hypothetical protein
VKPNKLTIARAGRHSMANVDQASILIEGSYRRIVGIGVRHMHLTKEFGTIVRDSIHVVPAIP